MSCEREGGTTQRTAAQCYARLAGVVFGAVAIWGFIGSGYSTMSIFAFGTAANVTHAVLSALGLTATGPKGRFHAVG